MVPRKTNKPAPGQVGRSRFYYSNLSNVPVRRPSKKETSFDVLGGLLVVSLLAGLMILMRFILMN